MPTARSSWGSCVGTTELWLIAQDTLDAVRSAYAEHGVDLPSRQYATTGAPADDCDALVVWLGRVYTGLPEAEVADHERCGFARTLELHVRIVHCLGPNAVISDSGEAPNPDSIEAMALVIATDLWMLPQGLIEQRDAGNFLTDCQDIIIGNCVPFEWTGNIGGVELEIRVQIDRDLD